MLYFKKKKGVATVTHKERVEKHLSLSKEKLPEIHCYKITDSTNTRAKEYAKNRNTGVTSPAVFIAEEQTGGRGRLGRSFHSPCGGVYISFLIYPDAKAEKATALTAYAAVKLVKAVRELVGIEPSIKWVNDLFLGGKKLAGILTEGEISPDGNLAYAICGIGINLRNNSFPEEISTIATSVEEKTGVILDTALVTAKIIDAFLEDFEDFLSPRFFEEYKRLSLTLGKEVTVLAEPPYNGIATDILPDYSLLVKTECDVRRVYTGEISIRHKSKA